MVATPSAIEKLNVLVSNLSRLVAVLDIVGFGVRLLVADTGTVQALASRKAVSPGRRLVRSK